ncbi:hypothetical protein DPEC_G00181140 [Dallia pectoralis]|uniref:Uncharacterized protein n=1 Tax=Dallia pectoralis TaxID=75939 RepID=A0ACC2GAG5_DALPE|nr:hypothetical protein DPEC_G00181140 [Dallia pectoralis]
MPTSPCKSSGLVSDTRPESRRGSGPGRNTDILHHILSHFIRDLLTQSVGGRGRWRRLAVSNLGEERLNKLPGILHTPNTYPVISLLLISSKEYSGSFYILSSLENESAQWSSALIQLLLISFYAL